MVCDKLADRQECSTNCYGSCNWNTKWPQEPNACRSYKACHGHSSANSSILDGRTLVFEQFMHLSDRALKRLPIRQPFRGELPLPALEVGTLPAEIAVMSNLY